MLKKNITKDDNHGSHEELLIFACNSFFGDDLGGTEFSLPMGGDHFGAYGDFTDTFMDEDSEFDFSGSDSNIEAADPEDNFLSGFWGAAATMSLSAIPFLIGEDSDPTDHAVDTIDDVAASLCVAEMGGDVAWVNAGVWNAPGAASGSSLPLQSPQDAQPTSSPSPQ
jgi:hypothetical protein